MLNTFVQTWPDLFQVVICSVHGLLRDFFHNIGCFFLYRMKLVISTKNINWTTPHGNSLKTWRPCSLIIFILKQLYNVVMFQPFCVEKCLFLSTYRLSKFYFQTIWCLRQKSIISKTFKQVILLIRKTYVFIKWKIIARLEN